MDGEHHSSENWHLDDHSLPIGFEHLNKVEGINSSQSQHTIYSLDLREIYAFQLIYPTNNEWVFSTRDAFVWAAASKPTLASVVNTDVDSDERVAGIPFFGHYSNKTYKYRICEETFTPDDMPRQRQWVTMINDALEQWETATDNFILVIPEYKHPSEWNNPNIAEFKDCTAPLSWWEYLHWSTSIVAGRINADANLSEIRMLNLPNDPTEASELTNFGQMLLDPFKLCALEAPACTTSLYGYARPNRNAGTVIPSADITYNGNKIEDAVPYSPGSNGVRFNTCLDRSTSVSNDNAGHFYPYALTVHEGGHALGLSDWAPVTTAAAIATELFNTVANFINRLNIMAELPLLEGVGEILEDAIYRASHPSTTDSVLNYDPKTGIPGFSEPDCSPHPLDIMAIYSLYQTKLR